MVLLTHYSYDHHNPGPLVSDRNYPYIYLIMRWYHYVSGRLADPADGLQHIRVELFLMAMANRYKCRLCGYIYSPARGEPHNGIPAGTPFEDLPESLCMPDLWYGRKRKDRQMGI